MRLMNTLKPSTWALTNSPTRRSNADMDPVPIHLRTWTTWVGASIETELGSWVSYIQNYIAYWISDALNPSMWAVGSSMIAVQLSWRQALGAISLGHIIIAAVIVLNGTMGARLHVAFPVIARTSFGFSFSYFCVVCRIILSIFWFGIQSFVGAECTYQMLKAIWPSAVHIENRLPASAGITTSKMVCFLIFWLLQLPLLLVSPRRIRHLFVAKALFVPITFLAILTWAMIKVPPDLSLAKPGGSISAWSWLRALNSALGSWATLSVNIPDFTRYAINEKAQYIQIIIIPTLITLVGFCGIAVASASEILYGSVIWDPLMVIDRWENRAASFFAAFSFALAVLGTNISANSLSAANDMTVLMPRYINIRRGQVICAVLGGWIICPWKILSGAPGFLNFMSANSIFLGPFAGIMVVDYWIIRSCKVDVDELYNPQGAYCYWHGINWRAAVAFSVGFVPTVPGLAASLIPQLHVMNMQYISDIGFMFLSTSLTYGTLSALFPATQSSVDAKEPDVDNPKDLER